MGYVYILKSEKNQRYYIGSSQDPFTRLAAHNRGEVKATRYLRPLKLVFSQKYETITQAKKVEFRLKKLKRRDIIEKIIEEGKIKLK